MSGGVGLQGIGFQISQHYLYYYSICYWLEHCTQAQIIDCPHCYLTVDPLFNHEWPGQNCKPNCMPSHPNIHQCPQRQILPRHSWVLLVSPMATRYCLSLKTMLMGAPLGPTTMLTPLCKWVTVSSPLFLSECVESR